MRVRMLALAFSLLAAPAVSAQSFNAELHRDLTDVQKKFTDLANAIPESAYGWRPTGARSVGEVLLHVAADNYLLPIAFGKAAPAATGIVLTDMKSVEVFEKRNLTKAQIVAELETSFRHLHVALAETTTDANLGETIKFFGMDWTRLRGSLMTVTHLHEHLGQLIAYARGNGIAPPWSK